MNHTRRPRVERDGQAPAIGNWQLAIRHPNRDPDLQEQICPKTRALTLRRSPTKLALSKDPHADTRSGTQCRQLPAAQHAPLLVTGHTGPAFIPHCAPPSRVPPSLRRSVITPFSSSPPYQPQLYATSGPCIALPFTAVRTNAESGEALSWMVNGRGFSRVLSASALRVTCCVTAP